MGSSVISIFFAGEEMEDEFLRREGDGGWGICFEEREMDEALLMMSHGDGRGLMEYAGNETQIKKYQEFCFDGVQ